MSRPEATDEVADAHDVAALDDPSRFTTTRLRTLSKSDLARPPAEPIPPMASHASTRFKRSFPSGFGVREDQKMLDKHLKVSRRHRRRSAAAIITSECCCHSGHTAAAA